jgi:hypothetical protein
VAIALRASQTRKLTKVQSLAATRSGSFIVCGTSDKKALRVAVDSLSTISEHS